MSRANSRSDPPRFVFVLHGLATRGGGASGGHDGRLGVRQRQEQRKRKGADRFLHGVYHARTLLLAQKGSGLGIAYMQAS